MIGRMTITWHGAAHLTASSRAEIEAEIAASLGPIPASSISVDAERSPMQIRVIARSLDMTHRLGRAAALEGLTVPQIRSAMSNIVSALVRDWPLMADLVRESEAA